MKHWFTKILALVAALTLSAGLKAQDGPVLTSKITEIAVSSVDYSVARIDITNGGTGYSQATTIVTISGGSGTGATATATVTAGVITAVTVTNPGIGYISNPAVVISDAARTAAGNTEAQVVAVMGFSISKVTVIGGGAGYTLPPTVTFAPTATGSGAAATAVLATDGTVKEVVVTSAGGGYLAAPTVVFTPAAGDITGAGASATASFGYSIVNIGIVQPDNSVYLSPPSVTVTTAPGDLTGYGGSAKIILDGTGKVSGISVVSPGQYYTKAPNVTVNNDGLVSVPGGGTTLGGASILAAASIGSIFEAPFQNESYGPAGSYIVISALAQGTFPVAGYTYNFFANGMSLGKALPVPILDPARIAWTPPQPGAYYIHAEITDGFGNTTKTLAVRYFATGTAIQSPMNNTLVPKGSSIVIQANAIGRPQRPNAFVKEMKFYVDDTYIASDMTYPYSMIYTPSSATNAWDHVIEAKAFDNNGNQVSADGAALINIHMIDVAIPTIPTVSIQDPSDGQAINVATALSTGVNIRVKADGLVNKITRVELYVDGMLTDTTSVYPYTFTWKPAVSGTYNLVALAYDSKSNVVASDTTVGTNLTGIPQPTRVVIATPPSVSITSPSNGAVVYDRVPRTVTIDASASGLAQVSSVTLWVDGKYASNAVRSGSTNTWTASFTPVLKYDPNSGLPLPTDIYAMVTDDNPLSTKSSVVSLTVSGGSGGSTSVGLVPSVEITSPVASSVLRVNTPVTIYANAEDSDGIIASVQFSVNNTIVGSLDTVYPYSTVWTPTAVGSYSIKATTIDNDGNAVTSAVVNVTVADLSLTAPDVNVTSPVSNTVSFGSTVTLGATATDTDGSIANVQFFIDGQPYGSPLVRSPYVTTWLPDSPGVYNIVARATDNAGNQTTSPARTITVLPGSMPLVAVSSPADLAPVPVNAPTVLAATASDNMSIASVQFFVNGVASGAPDTTYPYRVTWTPTSLGSYSIVARATDNEGNWTDSSVITLTAVPDTAPTVSIATPADGSSSAVRVPLTLAANASDDSAVASVQFYVDNVAYGSAITAVPYSIQWTPSTPGNYAIKAVATDNMGNQTTATVHYVSIIAPNSPTSTITAPTSGATLIVNNVTTLTATATDNVSIASVQFYINGVAQGSAVTSYPYNLTWTPVSLGNYSIVARATDNEGNVTDSTTVAVSVIGDAPPSVGVTAPVGGSTVQLRASTTLTASANDDYQLSSVQFYVDGIAVGPLLTSAPWSTVWAPTNAGPAVITARAFDNKGQSTLSAGVNVTVSSSNAPSVSITAPSTGSSVVVNNITTLSASASDNVSIASVQFLVNGEAFGPALTSYPYNTAWTPANLGTYSVIARAMDNEGNITDSAVITLSVVADAPPTVSLTAPTNGITVQLRAPVTITATASDDYADPSVQFYVDGVAVGSPASAAPYTIQWIPTTSGTFTITAKATDNKGQVVPSAPRTITVSAAKAPVVSVLSPTEGAALPVNAPSILLADASDDVAVASVQFLVNDVAVGSSLTAYPYSTSWTPTNLGTYRIVARATDNEGNVTTSSVRTVTVGVDAAPVVSITAPTTGTTVGVGTVTTITATATDDSAVASVQLLVNGQAFEAALTATPGTNDYTTTWTPNTPGSYTLVARATDNRGNITNSATVTVTVSNTLAPVVTITYPAEGATAPVNAPTVLKATATDNGTIASVQYYVNGQLSGSAITAFPYNLSWIPTSKGAYTIVARATDNDGNFTDSAVRNLTVIDDAAPVVSVTAPADGSTVGLSTATTISATATDDSAVASVQFLVNGQNFGAALIAAPYTTTWTPTTAGSYTIAARAVDNRGNTTTSTVLSVTVSPTTAPVVVITAPTEGATAPVNAPTLLRATATDNVAIASVQYYVNGQVFGSALTAYPYNLSWTPSSLGSYTIVARATDNEGNYTDSAARHLTVIDDAAPTVAITAPATGTSIGIRTATTITAAASDDSAVSSVQFFVDGVALGGAQTAAPYTTQWTPVLPGTYTLTAVATDNRGNQTTSVASVITVTSSTSPVVSITAPVVGASVPVNAPTTLAATATDNVTVTSVQFYVNGVAYGSAITAYPYTTTWTPSTLGSYTIVARATDNEGNFTDSAARSVSVVVDAAPTVAITAPTTGSTVALRSSVTITASASDDSSVDNVQFFVDGIALGSAITTAPYTTTWLPTLPGTYTITARATDNKAHQTTSTACVITVSATNAPVVSVTAPTDGYNAPVNTATLLQASATDNVTVTSVQFFVNGVAFGSAITSYPYNTAWTPTTLGNYTIMARAIDNEGNQTDSTPITVHVVADGSPTVSIVAPAVGTSVEVRTPVTITAAATDDSAVAGVLFTINDESTGTFVSTAPYTLTWTPSTAGTYTIKAVAIDNKANQSLPATRTITVTSSTAPSVSVTAPSEGSSLPVNNVVILKANATDNISIASVQFYVNGVATGNAITAYPYNMDWTPVSLGSYTIVARATDNEGNQTDSAAKTVTVVANNYPTVSLNKPLNAASVPVHSPTTLIAAASDSNGTVVSVQFLVNGVAFGSPVTSFPYKLDWTPETLGTFTLRARATDNEGLVTDSSLVTVQVISSSPPTVSLSSPFAGAELYIGAPIVLKALAADEDGSVASVQFYANGVLLGTSASGSSPYTLAWSPEIAGPYTLEVKATDNIGVVTTSASVSVTVKENPAPIVSVTKPVLNSADQFYYTGAVIELEAIASDSDGTATTTDAQGNKVTTNIPGSIKQVQFFVNDVLVNTDDAAPYAYSQWIPDSAGTYSIVAKATDGKGAVGVSNAVSITVKANLAPVVTVTAPVASATLRVNTPVTINASASDPDGSVSKVVFYLGDEIINEDLEFPYTTSWTPVSPGRYTISARVYDNNGRYTISTSVAVTVADPSSGAPSVSITSPTANTAVLGTSVTLQATASDPDGSIASVEFFIDGKSAGSQIIKTPYSFTWTPLSAGIYTISARATDNLGNQTDSAIRSITVSAGLAPVVTITSPALNASYASGATVVFSATVTDANDKVASVAFIIDDVVEATLTSAPYLITRTITEARTHSFAVRATDAAGNVTTSPARSFTVRTNQLPTVSLVSPAVTSSLKVGSSMQLEATAKDNDGTIANVDFLVNDQLLSGTNTAPYKTSWAPLSEGVYKITALAADNAGDVARSADVYVRVTNDSLSSVDSIYSGTYLGTGASGKFAFINEQGRGAAFISFSDSGTAVSRYTGITIDSAGTFKVSSGSSTLLSGTASSTGVSGYMGASGASPMFLGTLSFLPGKIPPGLYTGSVLTRSTTDVTAIVSQDGQITAAVADGSFVDAGRSTVSDTGAFTISMVGGSTLTGTLNLSTGFLTATLTGSVSGKVLASNSSAVVINDGTLLNLSARGLVAPGKTLVAGFVVGGNSPKQILVRAIGPKLLSYGVPAGTEQPDPKLVVTNVSNNTVVGTNDNWSDLGIAAASARIGAFALDEGSKDAVVLLTLAPGNYTAEVAAAGTASGVALVEFFDVDTPQPFAPQKILNISARAEVGGSEKTLTAGFVISGDTSKKVLIRAVGPTLKPYGLENYLPDPAIVLRRLVKGSWVDVRENDNSAIGNDAALVRTAGLAAGSGLQLLSTDTKSAELLVSLPAGTYTAEVRSVTGAIGVVLVEVYEVP